MAFWKSSEAFKQWKGNSEDKGSKDLEVTSDGDIAFDYLDSSSLSNILQGHGNLGIDLLCFPVWHCSCTNIYMLELVFFSRLVAPCITPFVALTTSIKHTNCGATIGKIKIFACAYVALSSILQKNSIIARIFTKCGHMRSVKQKQTICVAESQKREMCV